MYSLISADDEEITNAKGVIKKIKHKEFVDVLFNKKVIRHNMKRIQSKLHRMFVRFHCLGLIIKDMYYMMVSILWLIFIKTQKIDRYDKEFIRLVKNS